MPIKAQEKEQWEVTDVEDEAVESAVEEQSTEAEDLNDAEGTPGATSVENDLPGNDVSDAS